MSLLSLYLFCEQLRNKRENIQRKAVFNEPLIGLSLETIAESEVLERKDSYTDESKKISELDDLSDEDKLKFKMVGYERLSDIANTSRAQIASEVDLPWQAIKEVKRRSQGHQGFSFDPMDVVEETVNQEEAVGCLLRNRLWVSIFLFEYRLRSECNRRAEKILDSGSRKDLVEEMYNSTSRARSYQGKISKFTGCSENYVKDVISGRIEKGLNDSERKDILERDGGKCRMCGSSDSLEVHHIIPVSQGGSKEDDNLCTLCNNCHIEIAHDGKTSEISYDTKEEFWDVVESSN